MGFHVVSQNYNCQLTTDKNRSHEKKNSATPRRKTGFGKQLQGGSYSDSAESDYFTRHPS